MPHEDFSIHKRKSKKHKFIFYVQFWDYDTKKYGTAVSSNCTSRAAAREWARDEIRKGTASMQSRSRTFGEFAVNFYDWDKSAYIRTLRMQGAVHRSHVDNLARHLKNHILPVFKEMRFSEISAHTIEGFLIDLHERGYKKASIKQIYQALRGVLAEAERMRLISENPCRRVRKPRFKQDVIKGVLSEEEARKLLDEAKIEEIWGSGYVGLLHYTINLLAATTGLRTSEIQAIRIGKIDLKDSFLIVDETWERVYGAKSHTKSETSKRVVYLSSKVVKYLGRLLRGREDPQEFVFLGARTGAPLGHTAIGKYFRQACDAVGIRDRKQRGITFHSWRHFWDSCLLNKGVPIPTVMKILGHTTEGMTTQNYYHLDEKSLEQIRSIQEGIL